MPFIEVWLAHYQDFVDAQVLSRLKSVLSEDERQQCTRFHFADDRLRHLVTRALVRTVLSRHAAVDPLDWVFTANSFGRPEIAHPPPDARTLRFNVSHTRGLIALAVTRGREVGIDVENLREREVSLGIADRFFSPEEAAELARLPASGRQDRFFEYWTLKESYIKARGMGLSLPLDKFSFRFPKEGGARLSIDPELGDDANRWNFWQLRPTPAHLLALCVERVEGARPIVNVRTAMPTAGEEVLREAAYGRAA
jgi:4'-phosphopantetheinyl transferase